MKVTKKGKSSMGLAAGQARLLTITARKSDCEYQSMKYSHQKIALARQLADLSNEYQNSIDQTKLYYDYYGTGDTSNPLSYGILMTPSTLNNYMPTIVADGGGRTILNSKYAAAARAAGIPQEGLGSLPSETMRNNFITGLYNSGLITEKMASTILGLPYNQASGLGGATTVAAQTQEVGFNDLVEMLKDVSVSDPTGFNSSAYSHVRDIVLLNGSSANGNTSSTNNQIIAANGTTNIADYIGTGGVATDSTNSLMKKLSFGDILSGNYIMTFVGKDQENYALGKDGGAMQAAENCSFWDEMYETLESLLGTGDTYSQNALSYAKSKLQSLYILDRSNQTGESRDKNKGQAGIIPGLAYKETSRQKKDNTVFNAATRYADADEKNGGYIGLTMRLNFGNGSDDDSDISAVSINLSSMMKAYLTYFYDFMNGVSATDEYGNDKYFVTENLKTSKLVGSNENFTIKVGTTVSSDDLAQSTFYDALFNQICSKGWSENVNIDDNDYLQNMLQSGMAFISKVKDDGYYYQGNYATDNYIKEVSDESAVAQAEAKYTTEKAKLNAKEETLDLKMKNLDTEISSLSTEYDTVKNIVSKNIERFKRYSA